MEGGRVKEEQEKVENSRWRGGEERGDSGSPGESPATANKDDRCAEIECRHTKQRTNTDIENSHTPSHTANIWGDSTAEREIKDVLCVITTARQNIPLAKIGVESVDMKRAMTGAIIIKVPGDKDRDKASLLATRLTKVLDPTTVRIAAPARMAEVRVVGIDI
jgi:hypothetical protein